MEKVKNSSSGAKPTTTTILIATVLIILISTLSVISVFFVFTIQQDIKTNKQQSEEYYSLYSVVESDVGKILEFDSQKQQLASVILLDFLYLDDWITQMKYYNTTVEPGSYMLEDIDQAAIQAVAKIEVINMIIRETYAYNWTLYLGGNSSNHYDPYFQGNDTSYLKDVNRLYDEYLYVNDTLDEDLLFWINLAYFPNEPEILQLNIWNWDFELDWDSTPVLRYGQLTAFYSAYLGINMSDISSWDLEINAETYEARADYLEGIEASMTSALVLFTVSAVVVAFVVSISDKKYIRIGLLGSIIVAAIAIFMFFSGIIDLSMIELQVGLY